ncbi:LTA synthase family protein [Arcobacter sp. LA11]|uniref:LTA synthase family protein n=1 Tax=Arcobacter sp. LA11 TaxID=1898176 RepID=UPI000935062F|nr:alkaline phosphatase family protein [Arcobacter sp. LA11]
MRAYFLVFFSAYFIILLTKFIFIFYLGNQFSEFSFNELTYAIFWGIKFDFAASAIFAFITTLFDFNKKTFAFIGAISIITIFLTQISDILYFDESSRHVGYEIIDIISDAKSLFLTAFSQHTLITSLALILSIIVFLIFYTLFKNIEVTKFNKYYLLKKLFIILISIFFIRGMFQHIPLHPWQSNEIGNSQLASVSLNSIYNIVYTIVNKRKKVSMVKIKDIDKETLESSLLEIYKEPNEDKKLPAINTKPNIIFFFLEGWSAKFMSAYGFEGNTTPVYDSILEKSLRTRFMIANGRRTTEGIFATLASYQNPLGKTIAKTQLQNYEYDSIIYELTKNGYDSAFFQGSSKDTSGTGSLVNNLGFRLSYGKRDVKERIYEENYWGIQDTDLYNFVEKKLDNNTIKKPFVLGINGATTHDIITPKDYKKQSFVKEEGFNNKLNALSYADSALGEFIENIESKYPNTIFVLFADHCNGTIIGNMENYMIPFAIYSKKLIKPNLKDVVISQRDIAPTIYDLTIGNSEAEMKNFTGKSLISNKNFYTDYFRNGILGWIEGNDVVEINISTNALECFKLEGQQRDKTVCEGKHQNMKNRALSFTKLSQKLLFEGESKSFNQYKKEQK